MEAGLLALAELEEEARDIHRKQVITRREDRADALEARREKLANSIARKTEKVNRFKQAKHARSLAWQDNQKSSKIKESQQRKRTNAKVAVRRRRNLDRDRARCPDHLTCPPHRAKIDCESCNPRAASAGPSQLLRQLAQPDAQSVRDALFAVAANEEEEAELNRIYSDLGSPPASPIPAETLDIFSESTADSQWFRRDSASTADESGLNLAFKIQLKGVELKAAGRIASGCSDSRCTGLLPAGQPTVISIDRSLPAGSQALRWLAESSTKECTKECEGQCGCCIAVRASGPSGDFMRNYLSRRASIGVGILTDRRVAHILPWDQTVESELSAAAGGLTLPEGLNDEWFLLMVCRGAATVSERPLSPTSVPTSNKTKWDEAVHHCSEDGADVKTAELRAAQKSIYSSLYRKMKAGKNPTHLFWEMNRTHDGFIKESEWTRAVMELPLSVPVPARMIRKVFLHTAGKNKTIEFKELLHTLRKLSCIRHDYFDREWHQPGDMNVDCVGNSQRLAAHLYNPMPNSRANSRVKTTPAFSFKGEFKPKVESNYVRGNWNKGVWIPVESR